MKITSLWGIYNGKSILQLVTYLNLLTRCTYLVVWTLEWGVLVVGKPSSRRAFIRAPINPHMYSDHWTHRNYLSYAYVLTIVIWIQLDYLSKVMNLLGHLNWEEFMSFDSWAKASKLSMGHLVFRPLIIWICSAMLSQSKNLLGLFNWDKFAPRNGVVECFKMVVGKLV